MKNSLGLDVHGTTESQDQGQSSDTARPTTSPRIHREEDREVSWGILAEASTTQHDGPKRDTEDSWGILAEASTAQQGGMWEKGTEDSWGIAVETSTTRQGGGWEGGKEDSWGILPEASTTQQGDSKRDTEDSWGQLEEASITQKHDEPKKDKEDIWGTLEEETSTTHTDDKSKKEKGSPYVPATPPARAKMSPEELAERMEKIRLQNEKIKERREHVKADEEAFNTSVAADRARQAANRKVQAQINQNREQNAKKKLEKMGNREWDSGKHGGEWKQGIRGRSKSSVSSSKDGGRQPTTAKPKHSVDVSLPAANDSSPLSQEDRPNITSKNAIDN